MNKNTELNNARESLNEKWEFKTFISKSYRTIWNRKRKYRSL